MDLFHFSVQKWDILWYISQMKSEDSNLEDYATTLQSKGRYYFIQTEALKKIGLSYQSFRRSAHRLIKKNRIKRVCKGFFIIVPFEYISTGTLPASWFIDPLMQYLGAKYYVSLLTAASIYGASHQQPMTFQVICDQHIPNIILGNLSISFHARKEIKSDFYKAIKTETGTMNAAIPTIAICDCLRYMEAAAHINNIATVLLEIQDQIDINKLVEYAEEGYLELINVQRLGYLIEYLQLSLPTEALYQWLQTKNTQYRLLIPGNSDIIEKNTKWKINVNEKVEPDEI